MEFKETKIATYTEGKTRVQLLKLTNLTEDITVTEIYNTVEGYIVKYNNGEETKIKSSFNERNKVEMIAKKWELKKDNENYYYKPSEEIRKNIEIKYQIRVNRKRIYTTRFEYNARKYFATIVQNNILQLKIN